MVKLNQNAAAMTCVTFSDSPAAWNSGTYFPATLPTPNVKEELIKPRTIAKSPSCSLPKPRATIGVEIDPRRIGKSHAITLKSEFAVRLRRFPVGSDDISQCLLVRRDSRSGAIA